MGERGEVLSTVFDAAVQASWQGFCPPAAGLALSISSRPQPIIARAWEAGPAESTLWVDVRAVPPPNMTSMPPSA